MTYFFEMLAVALLFHLGLCAFYTKELAIYPFIGRTEKIIKGLVLWLLPLFGPLYIWHFLDLGPVTNNQADNKLQGEDTHANHP